MRVVLCLLASSRPWSEFRVTGEVPGHRYPVVRQAASGTGTPVLSHPTPTRFAAESRLSFKHINKKPQLLTQLGLSI